MPQSLPMLSSIIILLLCISSKHSLCALTILEFYTEPRRLKKKIIKLAEDWGTWTNFMIMSLSCLTLEHREVSDEEQMSIIIASCSTVTVSGTHQFEPKRRRLCHGSLATANNPLFIKSAVTGSTNMDFFRGTMIIRSKNVRYQYISWYKKKRQ